MNHDAGVTTMRVTDIEISDLHFSTDRNRHEGYVSMTIARKEDAVQVQFHCSAEEPEDCPPEMVTRELIDDALRRASAAASAGSKSTSRRRI